MLTEAGMPCEAKVLSIFGITALALVQVTNSTSAHLDCLHTVTNTYLSELLRYSNIPRLLRSSSQNCLAVPRSRLKTYGDRAFSVVAPLSYGINCLLNLVRGVTSVDQFRDTLEDILI